MELHRLALNVLVDFLCNLFFGLGSQIRKWPLPDVAQEFSQKFDENIISDQFLGIRVIRSNFIDDISEQERVNYAENLRHQQKDK